MQPPLRTFTFAFAFAPLDMVVMGPGCKPGLFFATMALVEPGDEVIIPDPGFPTYTNMIKVAGGTPVRLVHVVCV